MVSGQTGNDEVDGNDGLREDLEDDREDDLRHSGGGGDSGDAHLRIHATRPAPGFDHAYPVGNGRLGAMVHGRTATELLQLNEDSVWYGGPQKRTPPDAAHHLIHLRRLIRAGRHAEAEELVRRAFFATPSSMRHYEPAGKLDIEFGHGELAVGGTESEAEAGGIPGAHALLDRDGKVIVAPLGQEELETGEIVEEEGTGSGRTNRSVVKDYRRWLDMQSAVASTTYRICGTAKDKSSVSVARHVLASFPDQVILVRVEASEKIEFVVRLNRTSEIEYETNEFLDSIRAADRRIILHAVPGGKNSNQLCLALGVSTDDNDAHVEEVGNCIVVSSAACTIAVAIQTTYRRQDPEAAALSDITTALSRPWTELLARHSADYASLFNRTSLRLWPDASSIPTAKRLDDGHCDPGLVALYYNYGRYLLIACSRSDNGRKALPATLQGIWNPSFAAAWGSRYTINVNLQMNYWPAAASSLLVACAEPVLSLLERMAERGRETARTMYGCGGWCAHHNTDIWADTSPQDRWMPATLWPLGGAWMVAEIAEALRTEYDAAMHARLAPVLSGVVEFLLDFLVESECGRYLVVSPSLSPENTYLAHSGEAAVFCEGSTMDMTIVRWVFELFLWTTETLHEAQTEDKHETKTLTARTTTALARLPPLLVNSAGLLQEWGLADVAELEPGHRHVSHLLGLYPGRHFLGSSAKEQDLRAAARAVLRRRAAHGGGHSGWSRAWLLCLHARLGDAEECAKHADLLLARSTLPNLLDTHPPFQIDGNFGGCAGILECLVQSREMTASDRDAEGMGAGAGSSTSPEGEVVVVELLPSCPSDWAKGRLAGVRVRGGWRVTFQWEGGVVTEPVLVDGRSRATARGSVKVYAGGRHVEVLYA